MDQHRNLAYEVLNLQQCCGFPGIKASLCFNIRLRDEALRTMQPLPDAGIDVRFLCQDAMDFAIVSTHSCRPNKHVHLPSSVHP